MLFISS